jgi:hypothetical protein
VSLFVSFALSCNLPNVIYYSTTYNQGVSLYNENYYYVGYYNKISNNGIYKNFGSRNYRYVLLFDVNTFYYYFSFYMIYVIYKLTTNLLSKLITCNTKNDASTFLNSVIKKRTRVNMNDTYYIPEGDGEGDGEEEGGEEGDEEGEEGEGDRSSCDEDCEECWTDGDKEGEGEGEGEGEASEGGCSCNGDGEGECSDCNNENCTYFSIDNKCKIRCVNCE